MLAERLAVGFQQIRSAVESVRSSSERVLRVTAEPAFAARWLVPRLADFSAEYPDIELILESTDEIRALGRDADLAIRYVRAGSRPGGRGTRHLLDVQGAPVIAGARLGTRDRSDSAVLDYRLVHDDAGNDWKKWFAAAGLSGYARLKHLRFSDHTLALEAARRGQGVVLGTVELIEQELAAGDLAVIGTTRIALGAYWLLRASDRAGAGLRASFTQWLDRKLQAL